MSIEQARQGPNKQENSFKEQFAKLETIETAGGTAEVVDIAPAQSKDEGPVLFAPAWACTLPVYKPALETLVNEGRRVLSLNHPRRGGEMKLTYAEKELVKEYPNEEVRKALTLRDILNKKGVGKVDVIAHSEGAVNAAIAALLNPEKFRNIVFFGPAGLIGGDNAIRLFKGFAAQGNPKPSLKEIPVGEQQKKATQAEGRTAIEYPEIPTTETAKQVGATAGREALKYMGQNPFRAIKEGWGLSKVQIDSLIDKLHERGIGIVVISAVDDPVFPTKTMAERLKKGSLDGFLSVRGGHGQIGEHPEHYMAMANQMLEKLRDRGRQPTINTSDE